MDTRPRWVKMFANHISNKVLTLRIYKDNTGILNLVIKESIENIKKLNRNFTKKR